MSDQPQHKPGAFPSTMWSAVRMAGEESSGGPRELLNALLLVYLPALRAHLQYKRTVPTDQIDDVLQGFVSDKMLEHKLLACADRGVGKFRTLLLTALDRYIISQRRYAAARKRATENLVHLDAVEEDAAIVDPAAAPDPFNLTWARETMDAAVRRMRRECEAARRNDIWDVFEARLLGPALYGREPVAYERLAADCKLADPRQASNVLITGKRMFERILRAVVGEYTPEEEIDAEIFELRQALAQGPARLGRPEELAAALRRQLAAPLDADRTALAQGCGTLAELLGAAQPPLELLRGVKDSVKGTLQKPGVGMPEEVATLLCFAAIAAGIARNGQRISALADDALRRGFQWALDQRWTPDDLRALFTAALQRLE